MKICLERALRDGQEKFLLNEIFSRFLNGESREEILKDLGLPSHSYIWKLADRCSIFKPSFVFSSGDWRVLTSMIEKSVSERLAPRFQIPKQEAGGGLLK